MSSGTFPSSTIISSHLSTCNCHKDKPACRNASPSFCPKFPLDLYRTLLGGSELHRSGRQGIVASRKVDAAYWSGKAFPSSLGIKLSHCGMQTIGRARSPNAPKRGVPILVPAKNIEVLTTILRVIFALYHPKFLNLMPMGGDFTNQ